LPVSLESFFFYVVLLFHLSVLSISLSNNSLLARTFPYIDKENQKPTLGVGINNKKLNQMYI